MHTTIGLTTGHDQFSKITKFIFLSSFLYVTLRVIKKNQEVLFRIKSRCFLILSLQFQWVSIVQNVFTRVTRAIQS